MRSEDAPSTQQVWISEGLVGVVKDLDLSKLPPDYAAWYGSHLEKVDGARAAAERIVRASLPPIRARMLRSTQLGAEALRAKGGYEIRLSAALPAIVHFTFNCLLRTPQFMYGIGDAEAEQRYRDASERIPLALPRGLDVERAIVQITGLSRPRDEHRSATAVLMTELAVAYSAYHELAHVLLGHVDALAQANGRSRLLEMAENERRARSVDTRMRLVWEYEADLVAANMLLQDMVDPRAEKAFGDAYGDGADAGVLARFQAMLGAMFLVYLLVAQVTPSTRRTHPEPLVRFAAVANDSAAALVEQQPQLGLDFDSVGEAVNDVALSTLSAWTALGLGTSKASPIRNLLTAQRAVERLELDRRRWHAAYSRFAVFYPFKEQAGEDVEGRDFATVSG